MIPQINSNPIVVSDDKEEVKIPDYDNSKRKVMYQPVIPQSIFQKN
jgi:hypothetical protein